MLSILWTLAMRDLDKLRVIFGSSAPKGASHLKEAGRRVSTKRTSSLDLNSLSSVFLTQATQVPYVNPVKLLPNVRKFKIQGLSDYHPVLQREGIYKREFAPVLEQEKYRNAKINRYVQHQIKRLNQNRSNPQAFWAIARGLMGSSSYMVTCYHAVNPHWYKSESYGDVWKTIRSLKNLDLTQYRYHILGIPKSNGETRPLGVPSLAWRVYLHGLNNILVIWMSTWIPKSQHGFYPGRGTMTAWSQIYSEVLKSANIYEFDLRKFFDSVNLDYLQDLLHLIGLPSEVITLLISTSRTAPQSGTEPQTWKNHWHKALVYKYHKTRKWGLYGVQEAENVLRMMSMESSPRKRQAGYYLGVSQGSPTSPLLSTLVLIPLLMIDPNYSIVQYADDGILYNYDHLPDLKFPPETGIELHPLKSRELKSGGTWHHPLKFLGQVYIPPHFCGAGEAITSSNSVEGGLIKNATRTPRDFTLSHLDTIRECIQYDAHYEYQKSKHGLRPMKTGEESYEDWFKSVYHGFLQSRLYNGDWSIESIQHDATLYFENHSWAELETRRPPVRIVHGKVENTPLDLYNASSYAAYSLSRRIKHSFKRPYMPL